MILINEFGLKNNNNNNHPVLIKIDFKESQLRVKTTKVLLKEVAMCQERKVGKDRRALVFSLMSRSGIRENFR